LKDNLLPGPKHERDQKLINLAKVIAKHDLIGGIYLPTYRPVLETSRVSKKQLTKTLKITHAYHSCFHGIVGQILLKEADKGNNANTTDFVFDEQPGMFEECLALYRELKEMLPPR